MTDVIAVTKELMDLFEKHNLTTLQTVMVLEAARMSINEGIIRDVIDDTKKGFDEGPGIH
jgi:hypothetical protein